MRDSSNVESGGVKPARQPRKTSKTFLMVAVLLGIVGALGGKTIMSYIFLMEGNWRASQEWTQAIEAHRRLTEDSVDGQGGERQRDPRAEGGRFRPDDGAESRRGKRPPAEF